MEWVILHCIHITFFLYSFICCLHHYWFHSLAIVNSGVINVSLQVLLLYVDIRSFGSTPKSSIAGSSRKALFSFFHCSFLWGSIPDSLMVTLFNIPITVYDWLLLTFQILFTTSSETFIVLCFLENCYCDHAEMDLSVVLICLSNMANHVENFSQALLAICTCSKNCVFNSFAHLYIPVFVHLVYNFELFCRFWILILHLWNSCSKIFSKSMGWLMNLVIFSCDTQKFCALI
jgi:hypothetical protein